MILLNLILIPLFANISLAKEDYVGINEGDIYTWKLTYDEDIYEEYVNDFTDYIGSHEDNEFKDAVEITQGKYSANPIEAEDNNQYKINVGKDKNLTILINFTYGMDIYLDVYDNEYNDIGKSDYDYDYGVWKARWITVDTPYAGYYYIEVLNEETTLQYFDLSVVISDWSGEDMYEDNDDDGDAEYIHESDYFGYLECSYGDEDWYYLYIDSEEFIDISISFTHSLGNLNLFVYQDIDSTLNLVKSSTGTTDTESCNGIEGDDDEFYILVNNTTPGSTNQNYSMVVSAEEESDGGDHDYFSPLNDKIEGVRYKIKNIGAEKEVEEYLEAVDLVEVEADVFSTENIANEDDWEEEDEITFTIVDPIEDDYFFYIFRPIIARDVDWEEVVEDYQDLVEDIDYAEVDVSAEWNGMRLSIQYDSSKIKEMEQVCRYQSNGVLEFMEMSYGGESFSTIELYGIIPESLLVIGAIAAAIVGGIAVAIFLFIRHKRKY